MKEIILKYNPFEAKASCQYNGKDELPKCMGTGENSRLQDWLYDFFPQIKKDHNWGEGSECKVSFHGTPGDFEDIVHAHNVFKEKNPQIQITLNHLNKESKSMNTRLSDLKKIFEKMQKESPYEELTKSELKESFDKALSSEFEISVIATMSSGKSTLINAILGHEILPARNEATTAKIAEIHDIVEAKDWTAKGLKKDEDNNYQYIDDEKPATINLLEKLNNSDDIDKIEIRGKIPGINSREMQLILSDTPGPNNSRSIDHSRHIDSLIKADYKPMIMYILNATQLEINDDKSLLEQIAKAMEGSGKQGADRFLFVLNKADELDPGKNEFAEKKVTDSHDYLRREFGIEGARIFPVSARLAKVIRMDQAGCSLTEDEEDFLAKKERFINRPERHFSDFVSLSPSCRKKQDEMLQDAITNNDKNIQALVYSGLPAIELAVDEYLEKYAITRKVSQAVSVFINIIKRLDLKCKTEAELADNEEKRKEVASELKKLRKQIENGKEARKLKVKFDEDIASIIKKLDSSFKKHETGINKWIADEREIYNSDDITHKKAKRIINKTQKNMELKYVVFSSDLSSLFENELKNQAQDYIKKYKEYISGLMKTEGFLFTNDTMNLIQIAIPDNTDDLVKKFTETIKGTKDEIRTGGNPDKRWYKPWTWFDEDYYTYTVKVEIEKNVIQMKAIFEKSIEPYFEQFYDMIKEVKKVADKNAKGLMNFFTKEIDRLDNVMKETIQKEEESIKSREALNQKIQENKGKAEWLNRFIAELEAILEV